MVVLTAIWSDTKREEGELEAVWVCVGFAVICAGLFEGMEFFLCFASSMGSRAHTNFRKFIDSAVSKLLVISGAGSFYNFRGVFILPFRPWRPHRERPLTEWKLAELGSNIKGLQEQLEMQAGSILVSKKCVHQSWEISWNRMDSLLLFSTHVYKTMQNYLIDFNSFALVSGGRQNHISSSLCNATLILNLIMQLVYATFQNHISGNVSM